MQTLVGKDIYTRLAILLEYPVEHIGPKVDETIKSLSGDKQYPPEVIENLKEFSKEIEQLSLDDLQGIYSYTFEMSADSSLDLGYHIYTGFKRAENLLKVKTMYREHGFPIDTFGKGELTDHLPLVLRFLGFLKDEDVKKDFRGGFVIKSLEKLNKNFEKNQENPYSHLINAVYRVIDRDVKEVK